MGEITKNYHVKAMLPSGYHDPEYDFGLIVINGKIEECNCLPYGELMEFDTWISYSKYGDYSDEQYEDSFNDIQDDYITYKKEVLFGYVFDGDFEYIEHPLEYYTFEEILSKLEGKNIKDTVFKFIIDS